MEKEFPCYKKANYVLIGFIAVFFIGLGINMWFSILDKIFKIKIFNSKLNLFGGGILFSYCLTYFSHLGSYTLALKSNKNYKSDIKDDVEDNNNGMKIFKYLFSFDYMLADYFKNKLKKHMKSELKNTDEEEKKEKEAEKKAILIEYFNWANLSIILFSLFLVFLCQSFNWDCIKRLSWLFYGFITYRTFSRALEIIYAFYGDVATRSGDKKTSKLGRYRRLSLAVFSYIEMMLSYSLIYLGLAGGKILDKIYRSISIMTFTNIKLVKESPKFLLNLNKFIVMTQLIVSLTLVAFAIAKYLSTDE